jgi:hypothetical protein
MVIFNEKDGKANESWKKALAEATSGKDFKDTRAAVLKMMEDAQALRGKARKVKSRGKKAITG